MRRNMQACSVEFMWHLGSPPLRQPWELGLTWVRIYQNDKPYRSKQTKHKIPTHGLRRVNKLYATGRGFASPLGCVSHRNLLTVKTLEINMNTLTLDEVWDLAELACTHAYRNDEDPEYFDKFTALHEKLVAMAMAMRTKSGE